MVFLVSQAVDNALEVNNPVLDRAVRERPARIRLVDAVKRHGLEVRGKVLLCHFSGRSVKLPLPPRIRVIP